MISRFKSLSLRKQTWLCYVLFLSLVLVPVGVAYAATQQEADDRDDDAEFQQSESESERAETWTEVDSVWDDIQAERAVLNGPGCSHVEGQERTNILNELADAEADWDLAKDHFDDGVDHEDTGDGFHGYGHYVYDMFQDYTSAFNNWTWAYNEYTYAIVDYIEAGGTDLTAAEADEVDAHNLLVTAGCY